MAKLFTYNMKMKKDWEQKSVGTSNTFLLNMWYLFKLYHTVMKKERR